MMPVHDVVYRAGMALASTIPAGVGARTLRALRSRPAWRQMMRGALGLLTLHWAAVTALLLLFALPVDEANGGWVGNVVLPESFAWPLFLYIVAFPLAMPLTAWAWIRIARAAIWRDDQRRRRRWVPALALVLFGLQTACWIPFVITLSRD